MDIWNSVARRCVWLLGSASDETDSRGRFVGLAVRPPAPVTVLPLALEHALRSEEFAHDLMELLFEWGVLSVASND